MRKLEYDFIKGLAIVCVILLHSISNHDLYKILAPWHIWQAIPIFVIVSGALYTEALLKNSERGIKGVGKSITKLIKPALCLWIMQILAIYFIKDDVTLNRLYELIKQGGFGAGGYFIYIAIQNLVLGGLYHFVISKWARFGLIYIAVFSVAVDLFSYASSVDEELYRVLATRYAFFYALGVAHVKGLLDFPVLVKASLWSLGAIWLILVQNYLFDFSPIYLNWHTHTTLSGFVAYGYFSVLLGIYSLVALWKFSRIICMFGEASYFIFLIQMAYFWIKRWLVVGGGYPSYGYAMVLVDLLACLFFGKIYFMLFRLLVDRKKISSQ
jgi:hypothetical protein